jgi:putative transposase
LVVRVVKCVIQKYEPTPEILELLYTFTKMVNNVIRIGLEENVTSTKSLSMKAYHQLDLYAVPSYYRLTAISRAVGILRNYRKSLRKHPTRKPHCTKPLLVDCYARKIVDGKLRLPLTPRNYIHISLNKHTLSVILGHTLRSVTLTTCTISVCYSKDVAETEPKGLIGIDRNLDNLTTSTSTGESRAFNLSEATRIKAAYRDVRSHFRRNDDRIRKKICGKYGVKQRNRVKPIIHRATKAIIEDAKERGFGVAMEKLTGLRRLYRRGNGQGNDYRFRLNGWSFAEAQRQLEYKARWEGLRVIYVNPWGTSSHCATCGSKILESTGRMMYCPSCRTFVDRDVNASRNIAERGMRFVPVGVSGEAVMAENHAESMTLSQANGHQPKT